MILLWENLISATLALRLRKGLFIYHYLIIKVTYENLIIRHQTTRKTKFLLVFLHISFFFCTFVAVFCASM